MKTIWCMNIIIWDYESVWPKVWPQNKYIVTVTYILWSSDFAIYFEDYLMEKCCTWDNGSLWLKDRPCKIYVGQWPIFHGPLILPYIIVRLKLFSYIKKWQRPGVFVSLRALALDNFLYVLPKLNLYYRLPWKQQPYATEILIVKMKLLLEHISFSFCRSQRMIWHPQNFPSLISRQHKI